jgi:ribonuclease HI
MLTVLRMKPTFENPLIIFTDGASSGNPGPGGWGVIIVTPAGQVIELGGRVVPTTNNRMELTAVIQGLEEVKTHAGPIEVYTDSTYVIRGITQWIWGWKKRGWISSQGKEVANVDHWKQLSSLCTKRQIEWKYVRGHSGIPGNERVDQIAVEFSQNRKVDLFRGPLLKYEIAIYDIPEDTTLPEMKAPKTAEANKPYSYLSLVGNILMRHSTWPECERQIKGRSGAKFKKAKTMDEEMEIIRTWGFKPEDIQE